MEFWGVEVKPGQPLKVDPEFGTMLHVSQASMGESKKGSESAVLYVKVDDKKFVIGNLSHDKFPQLSFDLVFEKEFELSHNWKNGSVYFIGYRSALPDDEEFSDEMDSDEEEPSLAPVGVLNGKPEKKGEQAPAKAKAAKPESFIKAQSSKDDEDEDSDEDDESGDSDEEKSDDESDEDEVTPKKAEIGKKRPAESATKTPASKKAKANTPQKTDGKKGGHVATPHPAKQAGKTPGSKPQAPSPKSGGQFSCNSCKKSFSSDVGLQSHTKAKHSGK